LNSPSIHHDNTEIAAALQKILRSASENPFGLGREREAQLNLVHQDLLAVERRLGSDDERAGDLELARLLAHELRGKLTVLLHLGQKAERPFV
jgi:hypothetical protein